MPPATRQDEFNETRMRLDKWLWYARFYKTRSLAAEAVKKGKITANGMRAKPSTQIQPGDRLVIRRGPYDFNIRIASLSRNRKSGREAGQLYTEEPQSVIKRKQMAEQFKQDAALYPRTRGRPTKRDRRKLIRFKNRTRAG